MGKIKKIGKIRKIAAALKKKKRKIVFTNGCFDILHYGHVRYLRQCKRLGDVLIVGLNSDSSAKKIKGKTRPIKGQKERAALLSAFEFIDYITMFNAPTPQKLIQAITPQVLAKGGDWKKSDIVGADHVKKNGGRVATIPFVRGYSTTRIIKRIKNA